MITFQIIADAKIAVASERGTTARLTKVRRFAKPGQVEQGVQLGSCNSSYRHVSQNRVHAATSDQVARLTVHANSKQPQSVAAETAAAFARLLRNHGVALYTETHGPYHSRYDAQGNAAWRGQKVGSMVRLRGVAVHDSTAVTAVGFGFRR